MITIIIMYNHTISLIDLDSEFAPHSRVLCPHGTPHPTTFTTSILMPSRWGPSGGGLWLALPPCHPAASSLLLGTRLFHASGSLRRVLMSHLPPGTKNQ